MKAKFDFVSSSVLNDKPKSKRIGFILGKVKDGTIMVTDGVLKPEEEMELIKETMRRVDDGFPGIEVASIKKPTKGLESMFERVYDQRDRIQGLVSVLTGKEIEQTSLRNGLTLIGPAKFVRKIKKNPNSFQVLADV